MTSVKIYIFRLFSFN